MRILVSCSLLLQLLLLCSNRVAGSAVFITCDQPNTLCYVAPACNNGASVPGQLDRIISDAGASCDQGVLIKEKSGDLWELNAGCDLVKMPKCKLRLTMWNSDGNSEDIVDIDPHGQVMNTPWKVHAGPVAFTASLLTAIQTTPSYVFSFKLEADPSKKIADELRLGDRRLQLCIQDDDAGLKDCSKPFAYVKNICADERLEQTCSGTDCRTAILTPGPTATLSCISGHALFFADKEVVGGVAECSEAGWKQENAPDFFWELTSDGGINKIPVKCMKNCAKSLRKKIGTVHEEGDKLMCKYGNKVLRINDKYSAETVECKPFAWKEMGGSVSLVSFGQDPATITVECVDLCTQDRIKNACGGRTDCVEPIMTSEAKIECPDKTKALYYENKQHFPKYGIKCGKDKFSYSRGEIVLFVDRPKLDDPIAVACLSKCDPALTTISDAASSCPSQRCMEQKKDEEGNRVLRCTGASHYFELNSHRRIIPEATCKPLVGWIIGAETIFPFNGVTFEVTLDCISACHNRIDAKCTTDNKYCHMKQEGNNQISYVPFTPTTKEYSCAKTHLLRARIGGNNVEMLNEALECKSEGLYKKSDNSLVFSFDPKTVFRPEARLTAECVSKCHLDFVTIPAGQRKSQGSLGYDILECSDANDVMLMNDDARVFGALKCYHDGWKVKSKLIVPFDTTVHVKAECVKVCAAQDTCTDTTLCKTMTIQPGRPLPCKTGHTTGEGTFALFFNDQKTSGSSVKCTNEGWIERIGAADTKLVDFADKTVQIKDHKARVECRKLCGMSLIEDACKDSSKCRKIMNIQDSDKDPTIYCGLSGVHALFVNDQETTGTVKCTEAGWTEKTNGAMTTIVDFKEAAIAPPNKVRVECKKLCSDLLIDDLCIAGKTGCKKIEKFIDTDGKVRCGNQGTYELKVNGQKTTGDVVCTRGGWTETENGVAKTIVDFSGVALPVKVKVECTKLCGKDVISDPCKDQTRDKCSMIDIPDTIPSSTKFHDVVMTRCPKETHALYVNGKKTTGQVRCSREGWLQDTTTIVDFKDPNFQHPVRAVCRQLCSASLIDDECKDDKRCKKIEPFKPTDRKVTCGASTHHALFVNDVETEDEVVCTTDGWTEKVAGGTPKTIVDFTGADVAAPPNVRVHCKHKCHPDFVIVESVCTAGDESCSEATYDGATGDLTCADLANEILVIDYAGTPKEFFGGKAKCEIDGWKEGTKVIVNPAHPKFAVRAKCLKVCHPNTLNPAAKSRNYTMGQVLTCDEKDEMLQFNGADIYSDAVCSKEGWKKTDDSSFLIQFAADAPRPQIAADCVDNTCTKRTFTDACNNDDASLCVKPDMTSLKYHMSCPTPLALRTNSNGNVGINLGDLVCKNDGTWLNSVGKEIFPAPIAGIAIDAYCFAEKCASCTDALKKIDCGADQNCVSIAYKSGQSSYCSSYECRGNAYKVVGSGGATYLPYVSDRARIWCENNNEYGYKTTDSSSDVEPRTISSSDKVGCVRQIPCSEFSPLNADCTANVVPSTQCQDNLLAELQRSEKTFPTTPVTCAEGHSIFNHVSADKWQAVTSLQCNKAGKWDAKFENGKTAELTANARIVCAAGNPSVIVPTTPRPKSLCDLCKEDAKQKRMDCPECTDNPSDLIAEAGKDKCTFKGGEGRVITYNNEKTTDTIVCRKTATGFDWKTKDNESIKRFSAKKGKISPAGNALLIGGIVGGVLFVLIGGILVFVLVRRHKKKKAAELETLKTKGLSQKIDTIIDEVSVTDDVKTLVL